jgi:hypothetical protein
MFWRRFSQTKKCCIELRTLQLIAEIFYDLGTESKLKLKLGNYKKL